MQISGVEKLALKIACQQALVLKLRCLRREKLLAKCPVLHAKCACCIPFLDKKGTVISQNLQSSLSETRIDGKNTRVIEIPRFLRLL